MCIRDSLTAITDAEGIEDRHFIDSLLLAARPAVCGRMVDAVSYTHLSGYTALFGHFVEDGALCDEVVALCFSAPHSYTGEDVVELSCHGGSAVSARLLRACCAAGAARCV